MTNKVTYSPDHDDRSTDTSQSAAFSRLIDIVDKRQSSNRSVIILLVVTIIGLSIALTCVATIGKTPKYLPVPYSPVVYAQSFGGGKGRSRPAAMAPPPSPMGPPMPIPLTKFQLSEIPYMRLEDIERGESLVLQWGQLGSGSERIYLYKVESIYRNGADATTLLRLSSGHSLSVVKENATLKDNEGAVIGVIDFTEGGAHNNNNNNNFDDVHIGDAPIKEGGGSDGGMNNNNNNNNNANIVPPLVSGSETSETNSGQPDSSPQLRKLLKYPNQGGPPPESYMDNYCRYGCGQLAVTFPYYYRPFFGYGYPLVGTEQFFPGGYGGNPVTELAANGMMGPGYPSTVSAGAAPAVPGSVPGMGYAPYSGSGNGMPSQGAMPGVYGDYSGYM